MTDETKSRAEIVGFAADGVVVKRDDGRVGRIAPLREGRPIDPSADILQVEHVEHVEGKRCTLELTTLYNSKRGPARASTKRYRSGWDSTFGSKPN